MKIGTVRVSEEYIKLDGTKKWFSHERQYDMDTEDPLDVFAKAEETVSQYAKLSYQKSIDKQVASGPPTELPVINAGDREIGLKPEDILSCQDLKTLDTYRLLIKGDKALYRAFVVRHEQLSQPQQPPY